MHLPVQFPLPPLLTFASQDQVPTWGYQMQSAVSRLVYLGPLYTTLKQLQN